MKTPKFAIYLIDKYGTHVLLEGGTWTAPANCYLARDMAEFGYYLNIPRLFRLKREAIAFARMHHNSERDDRIYVNRWGWYL